MNLNRIEFIGHIGNDAEIKEFESNQVIQFSVAVTESYINKNKEKVTSTIWYECQRWGNNTQIAQYLKKGQQVYILGKPKNRAYQNENGETKVVNGVNVNEIQLLGKSNSSGSSENLENKVNNENNSVNEEDGLPF